MIFDARSRTTPFDIQFERRRRVRPRGGNAAYRSSCLFSRHAGRWLVRRIPVDPSTHQSAENPALSRGYQDHFSSVAPLYARARPGYPPEMFTFLAGLVSRHELAWDCGTGNGQAAVGLAAHFSHVLATDASRRQISQATSHPGVEYRVARAESAKLPVGGVDLVTVAQALHWFDLNAFYANVRRAAHEGAVIAAWCSTLPRVSEAVDRVCDRLYREIVGSYWAPNRRWVDECYATIAFPFHEVKSPTLFACRAKHRLADYRAYLESWSAVQAYREQQGRDPLVEIDDALCAAWGRAEETKSVTWPIHLRAGRIVREG